LMLFQKLVEQHRVHRFIPHRENLSLFVANRRRVIGAIISIEGVRTFGRIRVTSCIGKECFITVGRIGTARRVAQKRLEPVSHITAATGVAIERSITGRCIVGRCIAKERFTSDRRVVTASRVAIKR
jgi:hypothetical protein